MKYLIDDEGKPISKGYHEFLDPFGKKGKIGIVGGFVEPVDESDFVVKEV